MIGGFNSCFQEDPFYTRLPADRRKRGYAGAKYPTAREDNDITPMEGKCLVPAFAGKPLEREYLAWEHERNRATRVGDWKLVSHGPQKWELFDMKSDPVELEDLSTANPDKVRELAAKWDEWAKRCQVLPYPGAKK